MRIGHGSWAVMALVWATTGCTGTPDPNPPPPPPPELPPITPQARADFGQALRTMEATDRTAWTPTQCTEAAARFMKLAGPGEGALQERQAVARYNAALSHLRCKQTSQAKPLLDDIVKRRPEHHRARVQRALLDLNAGGSLDRAVGELTRAVRDSRFENVEALVQLARVQMQRRSDVADDDGGSDFDRAGKNLRRALAIDDGNMPALNQLALYYLHRKDDGGAPATTSSASMKRVQGDAAARDLAALVCSQAIRKNPRYAPIHNTMGLVQVRSGQSSRAAASFQKARQLDPHFFEAHMNYAAVNLQFRGFDEALSAYEAARKINPRDYDVHLGRSLAMRGQLTPQNEAALLPKVRAALEEARRLDPARPEAYYNRAILTQEFETRQGPQTLAALDRAKKLFAQFITKARAADGKRFGPELNRAAERMKEIDQISLWLRQPK